ncbi:hypothetical protein PGB90_000018 [Kerria lacca]
MSNNVLKDSELLDYYNKLVEESSGDSENSESSDNDSSELENGSISFLSSSDSDSDRDIGVTDDSALTTPIRTPRTSPGQNIGDVSFEMMICISSKIIN